MKRSHSFVVACCLLAMPAEIWAAPITFETSSSSAVWLSQYTPADDGGPLETGAPLLPGIPTIFTQLVFNWTFISTKPDSDPNPDTGLFNNAIIDCSVSTDSYSFSCDNSQSTEIEQGYFYGYTYNGIDYGNDLYFARVSLNDDYGFTDISFEFFTELISVPLGTGIPDPSVLITEPWYEYTSMDTFWRFNYAYEGVQYFSSAYGSGPWSVVPIPPALWLFGSGLLGLVGVARKKAA